MRICLPCSSKKRYLSGMDWIIAALNRMNRMSTGGSNASQVVLELRGPFDPDKFRTAVQDLAALFPLLAGRPSRDWTLCPFWKMPRPGTSIPVPVEARAVTAAGVRRVLEDSINKDFHGENEHLGFRIFHVGVDRHYLAMRFDHRVLDAHGAESFLDILNRRTQGEDCSGLIENIRITEPAHLSGWMKKFESGRQFVRMVRAMNGKSLTVLPRPEPLAGCVSRFCVIEFAEAETQAVLARADREAGFMMFMPYVLATGLASLAPVFKRRGRAGEEYAISVSVDLRTPDTTAANMFFNHMSFLIFRIPVAAAGDRKLVLESLRMQMYEQIKSGFPKALAESSMLMRILPLSVLAGAMLKPLKGESASLGFSCVGKGGYSLRKFMQADVVNLVHMPLMPVPPGIGFIVNQYGKRMNATLSYLDGMLTPEEVKSVESDIRRLM